MLGANMFVAQTLGFFSGVSQHALAFIAERKIHGRRDLLPDRGVSFDLLANGFDRSMRTQESVRQCFIFAQQAQQEVLRFYIRRPELARLIAREEDHASGLFCIPLEHVPLTKMSQSPLPEHPSLPPGANNVPPERKPFVRPVSPDRNCNVHVPPPEPLVFQRLGRNLLDLPLMKPEYTVAPARKVKVVGNNQGGEPIVVMKSLDQIEYQFRRAIVQITGGLVRHQDLWSCHQCPGQRNALLLAA